MASKKPIAKPASKKVAPKSVKAVPAKKAAAPKKPVAKAPAKKVAPVSKKAAKPVAKKVVAKPAAKKVAPVAKKAVKPAAKKVTPVAKSKASSVKVASTKKPNQKSAPDPKVAPVKAPQKPMPKKVENKKVETKKVVKAETKPAKTTKTAPSKPAPKAKAAPAKPVVIPKTTTKTVRKYQPEFVKSILDEVEYTPGAPLIRYNDNDLKEFRELIKRKLDSAKKELNYLQGLITRKDDMGGDESDNRYMTMEDGSLSMEREQLSQMASRQITFIDHLEKALMRIENKTYGICRVTGKLIDKARLRAVPHATLSIEAKMGISKG